MLNSLVIGGIFIVLYVVEEIITLFFKVEFPKHWFQKGNKIFAEFKTTRDKTLRNKIL